MLSIVLRRLTALLIWLMLLGGCDNTSADEYLERAQSSFAAGEYRTAVIELKNSLQKQPDLADARYLLGASQARLGDYPSALKEFERALDLGRDDEEVRFGLLDAKNRLGRQAEVIGELEDAGELSPRFAGVLGDAYLAAEDLDRARTFYLQATGLASGNLGLGTIAWMQGDPERARSYLVRATELDAGDRSSWLRLAELELGEGNLEPAERAFRRTGELPGGELSGILGLARVSLVAGDLDGAAGHVDEVLKRAPEFAVAHYLDGLIRFQQQDVEGAEAAIREVQRVAPDHPPSLYLMGAIKFQQGQLSQAQDSLQRFLNVDRANESAAKLLASVYLQEGNLDAVIETLEPFEAASEDPQLLAMLGTTRLRVGSTSAATATLERAVALAPDAAAFRNQLAVSLLSAGDTDGAEVALRAAIEVDGEQFQSDYLLAMMRMREQDFAGALEAAERLLAKSPDNPLGHNLKGGAQLGMGERAAARAAFETALSIDGSYVPAAGNLARLDLADGNRDAARGRYEALLASDAGNETALLALAELALEGGDGAGAERYLKEVIGANENALRARLGLARLYLQSNRPADALEQVDAALAVAPENVDLLLVAAEADLLSGRSAAAAERADQLQTLLARRERDDPRLALAVGVLQARVGRLTLARANLERVAAATPDNVVAVRELARIDLREGDLAAARRRLSQLEAQAGNDAQVRLLGGDLLRADGAIDEAETVYRALAAEGNRDAVLRLTLLELGAGDVAAALEGIDGWLAENPDDLGVRLLRAEALLRRADTTRAVAEYEALADTDNPVVLNNLAWLYMQRGDGRALATAERAHELAPDNADIADTLGWILVQADRAQDAVPHLRRSVQLNPENPSVRYHLARAHLALGDRQAAIDALKNSLARGEFPERRDAQAALAELEGA